METSKFLDYIDDEAFGPEFFREIERMQARWISESEGNSDEGEEDDFEEVALEEEAVLLERPTRGEYTGRRRRKLKR